MSEPSEPPVPYHVSYAGQARAELQALADRARERGLVRELLAALKKLEHILRTYPQHGEPLYDLRLASAKALVLPVPPLVVRYMLHEERRVVIVGAPISLLRNSGLE